MTKAQFADWQTDMGIVEGEEWAPLAGVSDSTVTDAHVLNSSEFSHFLDTLTERNQHKDFENFARKLCEREVCPNLRPQTGPEGGGDGKVDADSYPVASEISDRWFRGQANAGDKKWGVAISAMKRWSEKVRSDVEGTRRRSTGRCHPSRKFLRRTVKRLPTVRANLSTLTPSPPAAPRLP